MGRLRRIRFGDTPPALDGQDFEFVAAPNRFHLADFFEPHVWAWRDNPQGAVPGLEESSNLRGSIRRSQSPW